MDVKTAGRTVRIFEIFAEAQEPLSLSEVSRALDAPLSSCLYLVRALESRGYLYAVGNRKHVYPTRKLYDMARAIAVGESWAERLEPVMLELRDATKETIILGKRQGTRVVYLSVLEGPQTIRYSAATGDFKPLYSSAIGKALMSDWDVAERKKMIAKLSLDPVTPTTIVDRDALLQDIEKTAARGYSISRGENVPDVMAIAKNVWIGDDQYAISINGPIYRMSLMAEIHCERLIDILKGVSDRSS